jgi:hypothetical protein
VPLQNLDGNGGETHEERVTRLRDEFEGWDNVDADADVEYDDDESEADDDEVARAREARHGHRSGLRNRWKRFWAASM